MSSSRSFPARRNHMPSTPLAGQRHLVQPDAFQEGSSPGSARKATRRIIRRTPLWQRIKDLPENMLLNLQVDAMLLDFSALGWPVGLGLNGAHFLIKLSAFTASFASGRGPAKSLWPSLGSAKSLTHADERLQELQRAANAGGFSFSRILTYCSLALILISCLNALYLFTRRRSYRLHHRSDPVASRNVRLVPANLEDNRQSVLSYLWNFVLSFIWKSKRIEPDKVQQLDMWMPEDLYLHIFSLYPPPVAVLWHLTNSSNFYYLCLAIGMSLVQTNIVVTAFSNLLQDKQIVASEVMHEYDTQFVYPRIFRPTRDMGTMTNEAEMIDWRPPRSRMHESAYYETPQAYSNEDYPTDVSFTGSTPQHQVRKSASRRRLTAANDSHEYLDDFPKRKHAFPASRSRRTLIG